MDITFISSLHNCVIQPKSTWPTVYPCSINMSACSSFDGIYWLTAYVVIRLCGSKQKQLQNNSPRIDTICLLMTLGYPLTAPTIQTCRFMTMW